MRHRFTLILGILIAGCLAFVPAVAAFDATLTSPATGTSQSVYNGNTITVQLTGLSDGDVLTYKVISSSITPGTNTVTLGTMNMPFDFKNGLSQSTMTTTGLTAGTYSFSVTKDGGASMTKTDAAGTGTISSAYNIKHGNYVVEISGVPTAASRAVTLDYNITGTVDGTGGYAIPPAADLSFALANINGGGTLTIQVLQGTTVKLDKTFKVEPPPTPVPTAAPGGDTGGGGQQSQQGQQQAAPQQQQAQLSPVVQQAVTNIITNLVSSGAVTTASLGPSGTATTGVTLDVGTATVGGGPTGTVSIGTGTVVTTVTGAPVTNLGAGTLSLVGNLAGPTVTGGTGDLGSFGISPGTGITTLDFSSLFGSGGTSFNFFT